MENSGLSRSVCPNVFLLVRKFASKKFDNGKIFASKKFDNGKILNQQRYFMAIVPQTSSWSPLQFYTCPRQVDNLFFFSEPCIFLKRIKWNTTTFPTLFPRIPTLLKLLPRLLRTPFLTSLFIKTTYYAQTYDKAAFEPNLFRQTFIMRHLMLI